MIMVDYKKSVIEFVIKIAKEISDDSCFCYFNSNLFIIESKNPYSSLFVIQLNDDLISHATIFFKLKIGVFKSLAKLASNKNEIINIKQSDSKLVIIASCGPRKIETSSYVLIQNAEFMNIVNKNVPYNDSKELRLYRHSKIVENHLKNLSGQTNLSNISGLFIDNGFIYSTNLSNLLVTSVKDEDFSESLFIDERVCRLLCHFKKIYYGKIENNLVIYYESESFKGKIIYPINVFEIKKSWIDKFKKQLEACCSINNVTSFNISSKDIESNIDTKILGSMSTNSIEIIIKSNIMNIKCSFLDSGSSRISHETFVPIDLCLTETIHIETFVSEFIKLIEHIDLYSNITLMINYHTSTICAKYGNNHFIFTFKKK